MSPYYTEPKLIQWMNYSERPPPTYEGSQTLKMPESLIKDYKIHCILNKVHVGTINKLFLACGKNDHFHNNVLLATISHCKPCNSLWHTCI